MSDTSYAPDAAASTPAPASSNEVPINPDQTSSPQPIGPQAAPRPAEDLKGASRQSRREVIQKAFDKAEQAGRPGAAQARMGHNQPPEEMAPEKPKPQPHREQGRFARAPDGQQNQPITGDQQRPEQTPPGQQPGQQRQYRELPEGTPYRAPPPRFADHAKAEWHAAPESVRGEVYRMHQEVDRMHQHYRADRQTMDTIRPFAEMAQQHGTTLQRALSNYVSMEQKLREDAIGGLDIIVSNLNLRGQDGRKLGLRDVAYYVLNQDPAQHKLMQTQHTTQAASHQIGQLHQMVQGLAQNVQQMHAERQFVHTRSAVDQFADTHPRFDELGGLIEQELRLGFDLEQAYQRAERLAGPPTHAAQTRDPSAQTRSRSIAGAPEGPSNGTGRRNGKPPERREAIQNAIRRVNGSM